MSADGPAGRAKAPALHGEVHAGCSVGRMPQSADQQGGGLPAGA